MKNFRRSIGMILLLGIMVVIFRAGSNYKMAMVSAPELFGEGDLYTISLRSISVGYVRAWGTWLYLEYRPTQEHGQCLIVPLQQIISDSQPVYCEKFYRPDEKYFQGFIYFRGHERKFCGGDLIPLACIKIGEVTHG